MLGWGLTNYTHIFVSTQTVCILYTCRQTIGKTSTEYLEVSHDKRAITS